MARAAARHAQPTQLNSPPDMNGGRADPCRRFTGFESRQPTGTISSPVEVWRPRQRQARNQRRIVRAPNSLRLPCADAPSPTLHNTSRPARAARPHYSSQGCRGRTPDATRARPHQRLILAGQHVTQRPTRRNWAKRGRRTHAGEHRGRTQPQTSGGAHVRRDTPRSP